MRMIVDANCVAHVFKSGAQELRVSFHNGSFVQGDIFISLDQAIKIAEFVGENIGYQKNIASRSELK